MQSQVDLRHKSKNISPCRLIISPVKYLIMTYFEHKLRIALPINQNFTSLFKAYIAYVNGKPKDAIQLLFLPNDKESKDILGPGNRVENVVSKGLSIVVGTLFSMVKEAVVGFIPSIFKSILLIGMSPFYGLMKGGYFGANAAL